MPRSEADHATTAPALLARLRDIVGRRHVLTGAAARQYETGFRFGEGRAEVVVRPGSLLEMWRVAQACVDGDRIIVAQAANTGLTGGSTPNGSYDRPVVVLNTYRIRGVHLLKGGEQVVCLAGATLDELERALVPSGREPHSVIGSSCIGASVIGGVCNNSGGALVSRGPAYTEYALYGQVTEVGELILHNRLGIDLGDDPEQILANLESGRFGDADIREDDRAASAASDYAHIVRDIDAATPARFNADPHMLFEASGCAGRLIVFAVRLETFPAASAPSLFYIGSNDTQELAAIRRDLLRSDGPLPISCEYIHREAFDFADHFGKDMVLAIRTLGTRRIPLLFRLKASIDRAARRIPFIPASLSDRLMQKAARLFGEHLSTRMRAFRDRFEHHLLLKVSAEARALTEASLQRRLAGGGGEMFECSTSEAECAQLHRFAVAGAAVRYRLLHEDTVEDIVALDVALPRNAAEWFEQPPPEIEAMLVAKLYYGHFLCHVFHQDYLVKKGCDPVAVEASLLGRLDARSAEYPAEHNVGHLYPAKPSLAAHYRSLDPCNSLNPGIGKTSRASNWRQTS